MSKHAVHFIFLSYCFLNLLRRLFEFRKFVSNRDTCYNLIPRDYPVQITKVRAVAYNAVPFESHSINYKLIWSISRKKKHRNVCLSMVNFWHRWNYFCRAWFHPSVNDLIFNLCYHWNGPMKSTNQFVCILLVPEIT